MAKSFEGSKKKEQEAKKQKKKKEKEERKRERRAQGTDTFDDMIAYIDEDGNITSTPPDPTKKKVINADDIEIGVPRRKDEDDNAAVRKGTVTFFNESKGFGFIKETGTNDSIFTHIHGHLDTIKEGDRVTFDVEQGPKGLNAVRVKLAR
jgi:cold shock CspA family protein